jgi:hypothetical protein
LKRESVLVAVWPIDTAPKTIELGDTTKVPVSPLINISVPQADRARRRLKATAIARQWWASWCLFLNIRNLF